jgi:nucleotide-binding universal stress UspA family protein
MAFKSIVVFADGSLNGIARARMSETFARDHEAHVDLYVFAELPGRPCREGAVALVDLMRDAREDAAKAAAAMRKFLPRDRFDIQSIEATEEEIAKWAAALARTSDLAIVGRPMAEDQSRADTEILNGVLFESGRPCLVIPRWNDTRSFGKSVLVAYKGVREAARALHDALPILERAEIVRLLTIDPQPEVEGEGPVALGRLVRNLSRRSIPVETPLTRGSDGAPQNMILNALDEFGSDLLVMGGYGHARIRQFLMGGVTRTMLRECPTPLLLAH